jgi:hypothetical protein
MGVFALDNSRTSQALAHIACHHAIEARQTPYIPIRRSAISSVQKAQDIADSVNQD